MRALLRDGHRQAASGQIETGSTRRDCRESHVWDNVRIVFRMAFLGGLMRQILIALAAATLLLQPSVSAARDGSSWLGGVAVGKNADKWEIRGGVAAYDSGAFSSQTFTGTVVNAEVLAPSPDFLSGIGSPRPYLGTDIAISDDPIDVFYAGLNWEAYLTQRLYLGFSFGGSVNTDQAKRNAFGEEKDLGSPVLFHLQASAGFDITPTVTAQIYYNHFSNAKLAESNDGLESVGARIGLRF
jgi:hypothetical protein